MFIERVMYRDPPLIFFKVLHCVIVEIWNLEGSMWLMQKTYLFPLQIEEQLGNASKIYRIYEHSTFPPTGKAGDVVLRHFV